MGGQRGEGRVLSGGNDGHFGLTTMFQPINDPWWWYSYITHNIIYVVNKALPSPPAWPVKPSILSKRET